MLTDSGIYRVVETGRVTVVGFPQDGMPNHFYHDECRDDLARLIHDCHCEVLAFDFADVKCLASGLLGLLVWLHKRGVEVRLYHLADHLRRALVALRLDQFVRLEPSPA